jgi:TonB family protein
VKTKLISVLLCSAVVSLSALGPQNTKPNVRISCPLLYSHPVKIVRPTYPALARQTHVDGRVSLDCFVGIDGLVKKIEVKKGHPLLIHAATEAVSQWKFKPLVLNGKAVEMETIVNIDFQLPKDKKGTAAEAPAW